MIRHADARRDAPALRFLLGCVGGWILLRIMTLGNPLPPPPPTAASTPEAATSPLARDARLSTALRNDMTPSASVDQRRGAASANVGTVPPRRRFAAILLAVRGAAAPHRSDGGPLAAQRFSLPAASARNIVPPTDHDETPGPFSVRRPAAAPDRSVWTGRQMGGWSASAWLYFRDGSGEAPRGIGASSQLGGSQGGVRIAYGFGATGRLRAYARTTIAFQQPRQRDAAFGLAFAPIADMPVDVAIEQRVAAGRDGRTALAAMASGGVADVRLPAGFRLDAYAQAGIVGAHRRDAFADGAVVIDRGLAGEGASLRFGLLAAGAAQPGAARVDVGPRLTLRLPDVGQGSRIALDWRQRVAGDALPTSGLALTLAADF
ncbi:hypothetical protein [Sphingopyxis sp. LK2115]|jgi:hypothetical protein|uniref:hypothetical protein n=1 Tax=Sphingopyxis sp. LK2115 TaxID=2744558 RepID=UPI00166171F2|nr:hypothetical protein [Sphingopyxis sp. LK2115]